MSAPATAKQLTQLLDLFGAKPKTEQLQPFLASGDLVKMMIAKGSRLAEVDRAAFAAVLDGRLSLPRPLISWTPLEKYTERIKLRRNLRSWELTDDQIQTFGVNLLRHPHAGRLQPTGVRMWLGGDLEYNRAEAVAWLGDEVRYLRFEFRDLNSPGQTRFLSGSGMNGRPFLHPAGLDLGTYSSSERITPSQLYPSERKWPGLEVLWLFALNPQVLVTMCDQEIPSVLIPGLLIGTKNIPLLTTEGRGVRIASSWVETQWATAVMAAFREL